MNFRILAAQASPRSRVFAAMTAGAFLAAATISGALAQAPAPGRTGSEAAPKAPAPKAAPKRRLRPPSRLPRCCSAAGPGRTSRSS